MQQQLFKVRDKRNKGWFWMDNEYLNGWARYFGATGTAIYVSLCRHSNNKTKECFPAQKQIAEELTIDERTVRRYLGLFQKCGLISIKRERRKDKKWANNIYTLLDKEHWKKPEDIMPYGKATGHLTQKARGHQTPTNKTKNTNKTNISNYKMFYRGQPVIKDYGKLYVIQRGEKILFTGKESEITYD